MTSPQEGLWGPPRTPGPQCPWGRPGAPKGHAPCSLTWPTFSSSSCTATCFFFLGLSFQYMTRAALRTARSSSVSEQSCLTSCSFSEVMPEEQGLSGASPHPPGGRSGTANPGRLWEGTHVRGFTGTFRSSGQKRASDLKGRLAKVPAGTHSALEAGPDPLARRALRAGAVGGLPSLLARSPLLFRPHEDPLKKALPPPSYRWRN